ncbi:hypothetical protein C8Q78DRAFT_1069602 [Trametes maxima]|nr:hypothetical protein C8Q78DRAFT_1069602 [Trametes maxima]
MIKMVDSGTMELQIYHHLAECPDLYEAHNFPCVLPPTTIINSPDRISFVAMPMWGSSLCIPEFDRIQQVLTFIRCTLTGLAYLHDHRIAHRDIHETNILVNFYSYDEDPECFDQRLREHNQGPAARYAIFDFDLSLQLPRQTSLKDCRRPSEEGFTGNSTYRPCDVYQGESYYNPFAFDVGCLGNLFVYHFVEAIPAVPSLALLFAKMTTHRIDDRWTASEALAFVQDMEVELPSAVKQSCVTLKIDLDALDDPELYWSRLSPELQIAWQRHRVPPVSWNTRVLRWLITFEIGYAVVSSVRRFLHA